MFKKLNQVVLLFQYTEASHDSSVWEAEAGDEMMKYRYQLSINYNYFFLKTLVFNPLLTDMTTI